MPDIKPKIQTTIYAIIDKKADAIIGGLQLHKHEAAAVRVFVDIASDPNTMVARHPEDFDLIAIGALMEDHTIVATARPLVIVTGTAIKASMNAANTEERRNAV